MAEPKYTINVTVDNPELIPETPDVKGECRGFVLIRICEDDPGDVTISGVSVEQIAKALATNNYLKQSMAVAEGYIKAAEIARRSERTNTLFDLLMGGGK